MRFLDIDSKRLEFAKTVGASSTLFVDSKDPAELSKRVIADLGGRPDVTVDCSGAEISVQLGVAVSYSAKPNCFQTKRDPCLSRRLRFL